MRDKVGAPSALLGYVYRAASRIQAPLDGEWLRQGLIAVSIEDCSRDFRDVLLVLAELYVAAEEAGIDPWPEFKAIEPRKARRRDDAGEPDADWLSQVCRFEGAQRKALSRQLNWKTASNAPFYPAKLVNPVERPARVSHDKRAATSFPAEASSHRKS